MMLHVLEACNDACLGPSDIIDGLETLKCYVDLVEATRCASSRRLWSPTPPVNVALAL